MLRRNGRGSARSAAAAKDGGEDREIFKTILTDTNYESLCKALEEKNYEQAFTHIHNLKGLAMNLGLITAFGSGRRSCVRNLGMDEPERDFKPLLDEVAAAYQKVLGIVERLD